MQPARMHQLLLLRSIYVVSSIHSAGKLIFEEKTRSGTADRQLARFSYRARRRLFRCNCSRDGFPSRAENPTCIHPELDWCDSYSASSNPSLRDYEKLEAHRFSAFIFIIKHFLNLFINLFPNLLVDLKGFGRKNDSNVTLRKKAAGGYYNLSSLYVDESKSVPSSQEAVPISSYSR